MDIVFLLVILALLFIPSFLMMRRQRKQQSQISQMQANLQPGDIVVTSAGLHGSIVSIGETTVDLELAPGVVVTMEKIGVLRAVNTDTPPAPVLGEGVSEPQEGPSSYWDDRGDVTGDSGIGGTSAAGGAAGAGRPEDEDRRGNPGDDHPENLR